MNTERLIKGLGRVENLIDFTVNSLVHEIFYERPESVGTIRVLLVLDDDRYPGFDEAILDFGQDAPKDDGLSIKHIPKGWIKENQIAEVRIRRSRSLREPLSCLVSLRPYNRVIYGKPLFWDEAELDNVFSYNLKDSETSANFFKKFDLLS